MSVASDTLWWKKLTEGLTAWRICAVSVTPCSAMTADVITSTGTASSSSASCSARDPTMACSGASATTASVSVKSAWALASFVTVTCVRPSAKPGARALIV